MSSAEVYATYVSDCVLAEVEHRRSLEQRGGALITVSGALTSALFALLAIVDMKGHPALTTDVKALLYAAVLTFAASAALAIGAASPLRTGQLDVVAARREFRDRWTDDGNSARAKVLSTQLEELADLEKTNFTKARLLLAGLCAQALAAVCLSVAAVAYLSS